MFLIGPSARLKPYSFKEMSFSASCEGVPLHFCEVFPQSRSVIPKMVRREYVRVDPESNCVDSRLPEVEASCCGVNLAFVVRRFVVRRLLFGGRGFGFWGLGFGVLLLFPQAVKPCPFKTKAQPKIS
jgi:hypothetical protein